jgi:hypothetical protein
MEVYMYHGGDDDEELNAQWEKFDKEYAEIEFEQVALAEKRNTVQQSVMDASQSLKSEINQFEARVNTLKSFQKSGDSTAEIQKEITTLNEGIQLRKTILTELDKQSDNLSRAVEEHIRRPKKGATQTSNAYEQSEKEIHYQSKVQTLVKAAEFLAQPKNQDEMQKELEASQKGIKKASKTKDIATAVIKQVASEAPIRGKLNEEIKKEPQSGRDNEVVAEVKRGMISRLFDRKTPDAGPSSSKPGMGGSRKE